MIVYPLLLVMRPVSIDLWHTTGSRPGHAAQGLKEVDDSKALEVDLPRSSLTRTTEPERRLTRGAPRERTTGPQDLNIDNWTLGTSVPHRKVFGLFQTRPVWDWKYIYIYINQLLAVVEVWVNVDICGSHMECLGVLYLKHVVKATRKYLLVPSSGACELACD